MDAGTVEIRFGGAAMHGDGETLDDFQGILAQHMGAEDFIGFCIHH
jgi:hypothetical protein